MRLCGSGRCFRGSLVYTSAPDALPSAVCRRQESNSERLRLAACSGGEAVGPAFPGVAAGAAILA